MGIFTLCAVDASSQTVPSVNFGIWQATQETTKNDYGRLSGRLTDLHWKDIEVLPNVWVWKHFDSIMTVFAKDKIPFNFLVYTKEDAPDWLYTNGVPKVTEKDDLGIVLGYAPYYVDDDYKFYFKRMVTTVRQHLETLPDSVRKQIVGVEACMGSTGDFIGYKGTVPSQYTLTGTDWFNLFTEFSTHFYDEYKNTSPKITVVSNPSNDGVEETLWLLQNCPGGWIKTGTLGKGYQLNDEKTKLNWLYDLLNTPQSSSGTYLRARSEITGGATFSGMWSKARYKNMFALMCYDIFWGLDISNQGNGELKDLLYFDAFDFFNKYNNSAVQLKDPAKSTNAICALRDGLDASDEIRFPSATYGTVDRNNTLRYLNIANKYAAFGAKLEDALTATFDELGNLRASGPNDVGWDVLPGNLDRDIHQIAPNVTSAGYWNVQASSEPNSMYGKFARGFDIPNNKKALYFDVDSAFLSYAPLDGKYAVTIDITYLDDTDGSWQFFYDSKTNVDKAASVTVTGTKTNKWKKVSFTLTDCYFGNRGPSASDFSIRSLNSKRVIFSIVELSRSAADLSNVKLYASRPPSFDTVCLNSTEPVKFFTLNGSQLNGTNVTVGPFTGYSFSTTSDGPFTETLVISGYGTSFVKTIYVKLKTASTGSFTGRLTITGGGSNPLSLPVTGTITNTRPVLSAIINSIPCKSFDNSSGDVDLNLSGGTGPFSYSWISSEASYFESFDQDLTNVKAADYTVTVLSPGGCVTNATYTVTDSETNQPDKPGDITGADGDAKGLCGTGVNFVYSIDPVNNATSYTWRVPSGITLVSTAANGLSATLNAKSSFNSGTLTVTADNVCGSSAQTSKKLDDSPDEPADILGPVSVQKNKTGLVYSVPSPVAGLTYTWTVNGGARITSGQNTSSIIVTWGNFDGKITVKASNNCGSSTLATLNINVTNGPSFTEEGIDVSNAESVIATAPASSAKSLVSIMPNPAKDIAFLVFNAEVKHRCTIEITDLTGRKLLRKEATAVPGINRISIDVRNYTNGLYMVSIINEKAERKSVKLIKN